MRDLLLLLLVGAVGPGRARSSNERPLGVDGRRATLVSRGGGDVEGEGVGDAPGEAGGGWKKRRWGWVREKGRVEAGACVHDG
jgi:hypothetical protein